MLLKLNERIKGFVAWFVVILIAITFTMFGIDYYLQTRQNSNVKVLVNEQPISLQDYDTALRRARGQQDQASFTAQKDKKLQEVVLKELILNSVTVQAARHFGFEVTPDQANQAIVSIPQFQENGRFSQEKFRQAISAALFTPDSFQKEVRQGMLLNQQRFAFMGTAFALEDELSRYVKLYMQKRNYSYLLIPVSSFNSDVQLSEKDLQNYYEKNPSEFMSQEKVSIEYLTLSMKAIQEHTKITDDVVKKYYEENQNNYMVPAQWQVKHILFAVPEDADESGVKAIEAKANTVYSELKKNPENFDKEVKANSDDKLSIASEGLLPWLVAGSTNLDQALVQLTKPGEIAPPQKTEHGFEIFKLVAYKPAKLKTYSEVEESIKQQLIAESVQTTFNQDLEKLTDLTYQTPDSLQLAADELNLPIQESSLFTRKEGNNEITKNPQVIKAAFSTDVLEQGNNSEIIQLDNETVAVLRIKQHVAASAQPFDEMKQTIKAKLIQLQSIDKATAFAQEFMKASPVEQEKLVKLKKLHWVQVKKALREDEGVDAVINGLAFTINRPGMLAGDLVPNGNYAIIKLNTVKEGNLASLDKEQLKSLTQQIEANNGIMDYDLYVNKLLKQAKVVQQ